MSDDNMTNMSHDEVSRVPAGRPKQPPMDDAASRSSTDDADESLPGDETVGDPDATDQEMYDEQRDAIENIDPIHLTRQRGD